MPLTNPEATACDRSSERRSRWQRLALVIGAVLVAHGVTLDVPLQFDDIHQIAANRALQRPGSAARFFTDPYLGSATGHAPMFRPLLLITFWIDGALGGGDPLPYRITSLLLLVVYALLVARFAGVLLGALAPALDARQRDRAATIAALLVAVHPLLNETVLMASSRSSLLMATFALGAITVLLRRPAARRDQLLAMVLTCCALLTKETAVVVGLLAPLALLARPDETGPIHRLWRAWPVVLPVAAYIVFHQLVFRPLAAATAPAVMASSLGGRLPLVALPAQGGMALVGLARLVLVPWGMSPVHEVAVPEGALFVVGYAVWPLALIGGVVGYRLGGGYRLAGGALLWFVAALLLPLLYGLNTPMGEHRAVLALLGPLIAAAAALTALRPAALRRGVVTTLCAGLAVLALWQSLPWRSTLALWSRVVEQQPHSARAWSFLADEQFRRRDYPAARRAIERAVALAPSHPNYLAKAAEVALASGDQRAAGRWLDRGLAREKNLDALHLLQAKRLALAGELDRALFHAREGTRLGPHSSPAWNTLGNVLLLRGDPGCKQAYRRALQLNPRNGEAAANLAMARRRWPDRPSAGRD